VLNLGLFKDNRLLDPCASTNNGTRANRDIGTKFGCGIYGSGRVDKYRGNNIGTWFCEFVGFRLPGLLQIEGIGGDGRASSLDLSPEITGFIDKKATGV